MYPRAGCVPVRPSRRPSLRVGAQPARVMLGRPCTVHGRLLPVPPGPSPQHNTPFSGRRGGKQQHRRYPSSCPIVYCHLPSAHLGRQCNALPLIYVAQMKMPRLAYLLSHHVGPWQHQAKPKQPPFSAWCQPLPRKARRAGAGARGLISTSTSSTARGSVTVSRSPSPASASVSA